MRWRPRRGDDGAAAVEFALVLPILILILFGIIDYGLYFNAALQSRWGVHDAARSAAVTPLDHGTASCNPGLAAPVAVLQLACNVLHNTDSATAKKYVDIKLPTGWALDSQLIVCERLDVSGLTGFVPFPNKGHIQDVAVLTIERDDLDPAWTTKKDLNQEYTNLPSGDWSWCGA